MGAAIEVFEGARTIEVGRDRFVPVKTTDDLLVLRSDVYDLGTDFVLDQAGDEVPLVSLDGDFYKLVGDFDKRFPEGAPSLREAESFTVEGDWTFGRGVRVVGDVALGAVGRPARRGRHRPRASRTRPRAPMADLLPVADYVERILATVSPAAGLPAAADGGPRPRAGRGRGRPDLAAELRQLRDGRLRRGRRGRRRRERGRARSRCPSSARSAPASPRSWRSRRAPRSRS